MKRIKRMVLLVFALLFLCSCGGEKGKKDYYPETELKQLETFTSVTGIELNVSEDAPESDCIIYNYIMDNNADGVGAIVKYEAYLKEYGFEKSELLSINGSTVFLMDGYLITTGQFTIQSNVIQYVISIPNKEIVQKGENTPEVSEAVETSEPKQDVESIYSEFCQLVDAESYAEALKYAIEKEMPLDYADSNNYFAYASAMKLYKETELLEYKDIIEVVRILTEDVSSEFKDAAELATKINDELSTILGTCMQKRSSNKQYDAYYLVVDEDGEAHLGLGKSKGGTSTIVESVDYYLVYCNLEKSSTYMLCVVSDNIDYCAYALTSQDNYITLSKAWGNIDDGMFAGNYNKL